MALVSLLSALAATTVGTAVSEQQDNCGSADTSPEALQDRHHRPVAAASCGANAGIQYFPVEGYQTAAVIEDGLIETGIDEIFGESVRTSRVGVQECVDFSACLLLFCVSLFLLCLFLGY